MRTAAVAPLWHRIVEHDGEWCRVASICPDCGHSLHEHRHAVGGCFECSCAASYEIAEAAAHEAVKCLVGA